MHQGLMMPSASAAQILYMNFSTPTHGHQRQVELGPRILGTKGDFCIISMCISIDYPTDFIAIE